MILYNKNDSQVRRVTPNPNEILARLFQMKKFKKVTMNLRN